MPASPGCATAILLPAAPEDADAFLDRFMPEYDVVERHHINVAAPAEVTFAALMDMDLEDSRVIRAIFKGRELLLGAEPTRRRTRAASSP